MKEVPRQLLACITEFFMSSSDFNGLSGREVEEDHLEALASLVRDGKVTVVFGDRHANPHILALPPESVEEQLEKLKTLGIGDACLYPTRSHLESVIDPGRYEGRPYTYLLAVGEPQLSHRVFDLMVLESYRNDPRYYYETNDISGSISVASEESVEAMPKSDQILLQTFGFAYDDDLHRGVAVFLRYLSDLSPEHQQIWKAREVDGEYALHPDYFRSSILGEWYQGVSIFEAFLEEIRQINALCELVGRAPLFREDQTVRPREFGFLVRPTKKEFNDFVNLLDKLISQNINRDFFNDEVRYEDLTVRDDGVTVSQPRGTLRILEEWIRLKFRTPDPTPIDEAIAAFKQVRRLRQRPAHALEDDEFDQEYIKRQRHLVVDSYNGVRTLRLILAKHPRAKDYEPPDWLEHGDIWTQ